MTALSWSSVYGLDEQEALHLLCAVLETSHHTASCCHGIPHHLVTGKEAGLVLSLVLEDVPLKCALAQLYFGTRSWEYCLVLPKSIVVKVKKWSSGII